MAATVGERLGQTFVELADTLVAGYDLIEFLQTLTERCVELLGVDAAGLLLASPDGTLMLVAASTEQARVVELLQLQQDEGPCPESFRTGRPVIVSDIGAPEAMARWPQFAAAAAQQGFAGALVDVATVGILQERAIREQELVAGQLQAALNSRVQIEQAKGILAERLSTSPDEAFLLLRRYARNHNQALTELAADVINGTAAIIRGGPRA